MTEMKSKTSKSETVFGAFCGSNDPVQIERMAMAGWDLLIVDLQHGSATSESLVGSIMAIELGGSQALVRVPWTDPASIMRALDCGASGVIVPMVNNAEEAAAAARACRYPPDGIRSFGQLRGKTYGGTDGANKAVFCFLMIETGQGLANVEEILAVPGVDGVFVGPVDLKLGMGLQTSTPSTDPAFVEAMDSILSACKKSGKIAGGFFMPSDEMKATIESGWRFIVTLPTAQVSTLRGLAG